MTNTENTQVQLPSLYERGILVAFRCGLWGARMTDQEVTAEVSEAHKADPREAGSYTKRLMSPKVMKPITQAFSLARTTHRILTLAWDDRDRILSNQNYFHYVEQMRLRRQACQAVVGQFCDGFDDHVTQQQPLLGTMFRREDYPTADEVRRSFYFDVEHRPIPHSNDFRIQLGDATMKALAKDIEKRTKERIEGAMKDAFTRVHEVTSKMAERLRAYDEAAKDVTPGQKGTFRDSLVSNVADLAKLLPSLNITGDPKIDELSKQLLSRLCDNSPEVLRSDKKVRTKVAAEAEAFAKKMAKFIG